MNNVEKVLRELPLFSTFSKDSMDRVLENIVLKAYEPEQAIIEVGHPGAFMAIVIEGEVKVVKPDPSGQKQTIKNFGQGECFGEMSLVTDELTSADVIACEACQIAIIPANIFSETIGTNPDAMRFLAKLVSQRIMDENASIKAKMRLSEDSTHIASHELKSPLAVIALLAMAILEPGLPVSDKDRMLRRIISKAHGAKKMIDEYLTMSAISAGEIEAIPERINLCHEVIQGVIDNQMEAITEKQMGVQIDIPENLEVVCDPKYFRIVYNNLVSNAAKYGTGDTQIHIGHFISQDGYHHLNVASAGKWIEESNRERIFEKYVHLGRAGTGIGLHATREIIRKHGGDIQVEPCYLDESKYIPVGALREEDIIEELLTGNNFVFTIPVTDDAETANAEIASSLRSLE